MSIYTRLVNWIVNWIVPDAALRWRRPFTVVDVDRIAREVLMPGPLRDIYEPDPLLVRLGSV